MIDAGDDHQAGAASGHQQQKRRSERIADRGAEGVRRQ